MSSQIESKGKTARASPWLPQAIMSAAAAELSTDVQLERLGNALGVTERWFPGSPPFSVVLTRWLNTVYRDNTGHPHVKRVALYVANLMIAAQVMDANPDRLIDHLLRKFDRLKKKGTIDVLRGESSRELDALKRELKQKTDEWASKEALHQSEVELFKRQSGTAPPGVEADLRRQLTTSHEETKKCQKDLEKVKETCRKEAEKREIEISSEKQSIRITHDGALAAAREAHAKELQKERDLRTAESTKYSQELQRIASTSTDDKAKQALNACEDRERELIRQREDVQKQLEQQRVTILAIDNSTTSLQQKLAEEDAKSKRRELAHQARERELQDRVAVLENDVKTVRDDADAARQRHQQVLDQRDASASELHLWSERMMALSRQLGQLSTVDSFVLASEGSLTGISSDIQALEDQKNRIVIGSKDWKEEAAKLSNAITAAAGSRNQRLASFIADCKMAASAVPAPAATTAVTAPVTAAPEQQGRAEQALRESQERERELREQRERIERETREREERLRREREEQERLQRQREEEERLKRLQRQREEEERLKGKQSETGQVSSTRFSESGLSFEFPTLDDIKDDTTLTAAYGGDALRLWPEGVPKIGQYVTKAHPVAGLRPLADHSWSFPVNIRLPKLPREGGKKVEWPTEKTGLEEKELTLHVRFPFEAIAYAASYFTRNAPRILSQSLFKSEEKEWENWEKGYKLAVARFQGTKGTEPAGRKELLAFIRVLNNGLLMTVGGAEAGSQQFNRISASVTAGLSLMTWNGKVGTLWANINEALWKPYWKGASFKYAPITGTVVSSNEKDDLQPDLFADEKENAVELVTTALTDGFPHSKTDKKVASIPYWDYVKQLLVFWNSKPEKQPQEPRPE